MRILDYTSLILTALVLVTCGRKNVQQVPIHKIVEVEPKKASNEEIALQFINNYKSWKNNLSTLHYTMYGIARLPENPSMKHVSLISDIHILKDSLIWGSFKSALLGIEVMRIIFTKESITLFTPFQSIKQQQLSYQEFLNQFKIKLSYAFIEHIFIFDIPTPYIFYESINSNPVIGNKDSTSLNTQDPEPQKSKQQFKLNASPSYIFPQEYQVSYTSSYNNSEDVQLNIKEIFEESNYELKKMLIDISVTTNQKKILQLNQKTTSIAINSPFEYPPL